ncbi:AP2/ERF domain protein [Vibrio phage 1.193.O._10N.286.52.C6]|nr:AP2/ERF domain protein [Vibrio phage 1.193.O._10N.286.52.C6]
MSLKKIQKLPDLKYLRKRFDYNSYTGKLYWKVLKDEDSNYTPSKTKMFNTRWGGTEAGHLFEETCGSEVIQVRLDGKSYYMHRLIFKWVTGVEPELVDHEDGDRLNNRWRNLRNVSNAVNAKNCKLHVKNKSGHTGVSWNKGAGKWEAYIWKDSKKYNLGLHDNLQDAITIRLKKEEEFGYHPTHGKR